MKHNFLLTTLLSLLVTSCATTGFKRVIENEKQDILSAESFMRYNSSRFVKLDKESNDFIANALMSCHQEKFSKGLDLLAAQMHNNRTNPFYWNALGNCHYLKSENEKAVFYYNLGLESLKVKNNVLNPKLAESLITNNLGLIHLKNKRFSDAFASFSKAQQLAPELFTPQFNTAQLYIEFDKNQKALEVLKALEAKNPNDIDLLYCLSIIYFRLNDFNQSFKYISSIDQNYLNQPDIVGVYAYNLMKKDRLVDAKSILEKRLYSKEYNERNEKLLAIVNQKIKDQSSNESKSP